METFSIINIKNIVKRNIPKQMLKTIVYSMLVGNITTLIFFLLVVVRPDPIFSPRYWIPLAGMIIGNAMTGMSIGVKTLLDSIEDNSSKIITSLHLGAEPQEALRSISNKCFESAILPTLNSMLGMGIVFLPGMMTGQILSGAQPLSAIRYQIAIMLGICGSVSLSVFFFTNSAWKSFFNSNKQFTAQK
jgi:putative ABC transport system permease protein